MAHLLTPPPPPPPPILSTSKKTNNNFSSLSFHGVPRVCHKGQEQVQQVNRRTLTLGTIVGVLLGLNVGETIANAASRRPPPPPPKEKNDPNVSGVLAKVLASKKRKEAMKESIAKLREKGQPLKESLSD